MARAKDTAAAAPRRVGKERLCIAHQKQAGWQCCECGKFLCPGCSREVFAGARPIVGCRECGGIAVPILVPRRFPPLSRVIADLATFPLRGWAPLVLVLGGVSVTAARAQPPYGAIAAAVVMGLYLLLVEEGAARGEPGLPRVIELSRWRDCIYAFFAGLRATIVVAGPAVLYAGLRHFRPAPPDTIFFTRYGIPVDSFLLGTAGFATLFLPPVWMLAATNSSDGPPITPARALAVYRHIGLPMFLLLPLFVGAICVHSEISRLIDFGYEPGAPSNAVCDILCFYVDLILVRAAGLILQTRGAFIGYGQMEEQLEPVLGFGKAKSTSKEPPVRHHVDRSISLPEISGHMEMELLGVEQDMPTDPNSKTAEPAPTMQVSRPSSMEIERQSQRPPPDTDRAVTVTQDLMSETQFEQQLGMASNDRHATIIDEKK